MASTTSSTPARRGVLSPLNVNLSINPLSIGSKTDRAEKPQELGEALLQRVVKKGAMSDAIYHKTESLGSKRGLGTSNLLGEGGRLYKRSKGGNILRSPVQPIAKLVRDETGDQDHSVSYRRLSFSLGYSPRSDADALSHSSSAPSSPASSNGFSDVAVNDSQLTVPDDSHIDTRATRTLTQAELRQKAQTIKLRLRLASYKVRTNQVHVPMSHLEIRTIGSNRLPTSRATSQPRPPTPILTSSNAPTVQVQIPSAEEGPQTDNVPSSPPPRRCNAASLPADTDIDSPNEFFREETKKGLATPLPPCRRQGLLNPPCLGSAIWDEMSPGKELTSSVVKRGTADTLLSLKHQR